jgi:hypothetical protein
MSYYARVQLQGMADIELRGKTLGIVTKKIIANTMVFGDSYRGHFILRVKD